MRITAVTTTPLAIPLAQAVPLALGGVAARREPRPLRGRDRRGDRRARRVDLRGPGGGRGVRSADGALVRGALARRRRGDPRRRCGARAAGVSTRTSRCRSLAGIEVACWDALGKGARRSRVDVLRRRGCATSVDVFGFLAGRRPRKTLARRRGASSPPRGLPRRSTSRSAARAAATTRRAWPPSARRSGPNQLLRIGPERGVGRRAGASTRIRRLEQYDLDWVEQPVPAEDVAGARPRAPLGRRRRSPPTRPCSRPAELRAVLEKEAADVDRAREPRRGRALPLQASRRSSARRTGIPVNRHAFMESEISTFLANAEVARDDPEPDASATR